MTDKRIELMKMRMECVKIAASYQSRFEDVTIVADVLFQYIGTGVNKQAPNIAIVSIEGNDDTGNGSKRFNVVKKVED